jgi:hypothetical protein
MPKVSQVSLERRPNEHPLMPALRWANHGLKQMDKHLHDYSAIVVKRERRTDGKLGPYEWMYVKVRHKPFSVYMHFLKPKAYKGREVIYVDGANKGKLLAHGSGVEAWAGTLPLDPKGRMAMKDQHYPITEMGVRNLVQRLLEVGAKDSKFGECEVTVRRNAKIGTKEDQRTCTMIEVVHPKPRVNFVFHMARIYVDDERNIPIRYESYDWPKEAGGPPRLIEEYTYLRMKLNNGFTDTDFSIYNPKYKYREGRQ